MDSIWSPPANGHNLGHKVTKTTRSARQLILKMVRKPGHHWRAYVLRKSQYGAMQGSYGDQVLPLGHFKIFKMRLLAFHS